MLRGFVVIAGLLAMPAAFAATVPSVASVRIESMLVMAPGVSPTALRVRVFLPPGYRSRAAPRYPTLYVNDGQDAEAVQLAQALATLAAEAGARPPVVVAIDMPPDRMGAYGFSDRASARSVVAPTRFGDVGTRAQAYARWLSGTLVPFVDAGYAVRATPGARSILGWSLGAAQAFDAGWQYPDVFGRVGAFSPSFWLATDRTGADAVQRSRIAQMKVALGTPPRGVRFFIAVGTAEETADRDGDGINDALDDSRDVLLGWNADAGGLAGLRQRGYRVDEDGAHHADGDADADADAVLYVLDGGRHEQAAWARMLPAFLRWAYAGARGDAAP